MRKIIAVVLVAVLALCVLAGCGTSASDITVTMTVVNAEGTTLFSQDIKVDGKDATVWSMVNEAGSVYVDAGMSWSDSYDFEWPDYPDYTDEATGISYFWMYTINGVEPESGKANTHTLNDGDVVVFTYTSYDPASEAAAS